MNVQQKLKLYAVLTFLGLVMMTVVFVSPGWSIIEVPVEPPPMIQHDGIDGPVAMEKRRSVNEHDNDDDDDDDDHYYHRLPKVRISMGLWYYVICFHRCGKSHHHEHMEHRKMHKEHRCHFSPYHGLIDLPYEYMSAYDTYMTVTDIGNKGLLEFQIEGVIGIVFGILGFIASLLYVRQQAQKRCAGLTACVTLIIAGVLYMVLVGKAATASFLYREIYKQSFTEGTYHLRMSCPWGLYVGGVAGILVLISALGHLCVLSRNSKSDDVHVYHIQKDKLSDYPSKISYPIMAPPEYEQHVTSEEAGPLPEKEQI